MADPATRLRALLDPLLERDPGGRTWLAPLFAAAPHGDRLGEVRDEPGYLQMGLTLMALNGRPCFHYPVAPPPALIEWFIDHPDRLTWPADAQLSTETEILRRALIDDQPPGSRARAQERAHDLVPVRSAFAREWWRFEETYEPDCVLISDALALVLVAAGDEIEPVTPWFPARSRIHQALESALRLAEEERRHGVIVLSESPLADATDAAVRETLPAATPHLDEIARIELADGYLGNLPFDSLARSGVS